MTNYTLSIHLDPYLAQWFVHGMTADNDDYCAVKAQKREEARKYGLCFDPYKQVMTLTLKRGSAESDLLFLFLTKRPEDAVEDEDPNVVINIPFFKHRDVRTCNYLPPRATVALKKIIRTRFEVQLFKELFRFGNIGKKQVDLTYAWMEANGIEPTETNWNAVTKIYLRKRKVYLTMQKAKQKVSTLKHNNS